MCVKGRWRLVFTCIAAGDDEDAAGLVGEVLLREAGLGDEEALAEGIQVCRHVCGLVAVYRGL